MARLRDPGGGQDKFFETTVWKLASIRNDGRSHGSVAGFHHGQVF